jgi:hypothetical protein
MHHNAPIDLIFPCMVADLLVQVLEQVKTPMDIADGVNARAAGDRGGGRLYGGSTE